MVSDELRQQLKEKTTDELIQLALTARNDDDHYHPGWDAISVLHHRASGEVFEAARQLCKSDDPAKRSTGAAILAQLGIPERTYHEETLEIFLNMLDTEQDTDVLHSVIIALGHTYEEPRKVKPLLKFKNHPDLLIRYGVAFSLAGENDLSAIAALIELSQDEDDLVRDWATFGLGSQTDVDTPEIREVLFNHAIDLHDTGNAPGEGLVGLARRRDKRAYELILKALEADNIGSFILEAAEELHDIRLYPVLVKLLEHGNYNEYERRDLGKAIAACAPIKIKKLVVKQKTNLTKRRS